MIGLKKRKLSQKKISDKGIDIWRGRVVSLPLQREDLLKFFYSTIYEFEYFIEFFQKDAYMGAHQNDYKPD